MFWCVQKKNFLETRILISDKMRNPWVVAVIVGVIMFILSLVVYFITGKSLDYDYAIVLAVIFGIVYFFIQYLLNYLAKRMQR